MLNPDFWERQNHFLREATGQEEPPSFSRSLAIFYDRHMHGLWITNIILVTTSLIAVSTGHNEIARVFIPLSVGPLLSTAASATSHFVHGFDNL